MNPRKKSIAQRNVRVPNPGGYTEWRHPTILTLIRESEDGIHFTTGSVLAATCNGLHPLQLFKYIVTRTHNTHIEEHHLQPLPNHYSTSNMRLEELVIGQTFMLPSPFNAKALAYALQNNISTASLSHPMVLLAVRDSVAFGFQLTSTVPRMNGKYLDSIQLLERGCSPPRAIATTSIEAYESFAGTSFVLLHALVTMPGDLLLKFRTNKDSIPTFTPTGFDVLRQHPVALEQLGPSDHFTTSTFVSPAADTTVPNESDRTDKNVRYDDTSSLPVDMMAGVVEAIVEVMRPNRTWAMVVRGVEDADLDRAPEPVGLMW